MHKGQLEIFSTLKEITGFIKVRASHPSFCNFPYFRNLEMTDGRQLAQHFSAFYIVKTLLNSLLLHSLKTIRAGGSGEQGALLRLEHQLGKDNKIPSVIPSGYFFSSQ